MHAIAVCELPVDHPYHQEFRLAPWAYHPYKNWIRGGDVKNRVLNFQIFQTNDHQAQESCDLIANAAVGNCMGFVMTENWVDLYCNTVVLEPDFEPMQLRWMVYGIMGQICARNGVNFPLNFGYAPNRLVMGILPIYVFGRLIKSTQSSLLDPAKITEGHYDREFFCHWFHGVIGRLEDATGLNIRKNVQITHRTVLNPDRLALTHHS